MASGLGMRVERLPREKRLEIINEVIKRRRENVIYVDFVYVSMHKAIDEWYDKYYQWDKYGLEKKGHLFQLGRFYDDKKFRNHETLGEEREKLLEHIDLIMQMRRTD